jgi:hypothetical protein
MVVGAEEVGCVYSGKYFERNFPNQSFRCSSICIRYVQNSYTDGYGMPFLDCLGGEEL